MKEGYYITESGERVEFSLNDRIGNVFLNKNIIDIFIPDSGFIFCCHFNKITSLIIPPSLKMFHCDLMDGIEEQYRRGLDLQIYQKR